jgi:hypothetical protein
LVTVAGAGVLLKTGVKVGDGVLLKTSVKVAGRGVFEAFTVVVGLAVKLGVIGAIVLVAVGVIVLVICGVTVGGIDVTVATSAPHGKTPQPNTHNGLPGSG